MKVSFTHLIGYAIARAWKDHPTMGHAFRQDNGKPQRVVPPHINLGLAVDVQRKDGSRTLIVPVIKQADVLDFASFREVYEDMIRSFGLEPPAAPPKSAPAAAPPAAAMPSEEMLSHVQAATSLVKAHRMHGHLAAHLDPLGSEPIGDPALEPATVGLTPEVMEQIPAHILRIQVPGATLAEALSHLRETYAGTIAYEIEHISDHQKRVWLRQRIESGKYRRPLSPEEKRQVLARLTEAEALETYIHRAFLGSKSFSIEGLDVLVPMLDESFGLAADAGVREIFLGMAHRGRLNVLAHAVGMPYESILAEFEGEKDIDVVTARPRGGTGDVKYHQGAEGGYVTAEGKRIQVHLSPNPSHLEFVDPVVEGRARADQTERNGAELQHF